jgi:DICT domain-containing protein
MLNFSSVRLVLSTQHEEITIRDEESAASLSIGDVAEQTGVPPGTLRTWEQRYGIPIATRLNGGHRRYRADTVDLVLEVLRQRAAGLSMALAVERAKAVDEQPETSVFAGVRRRHANLRAQLLRKSAVLALSRALEDECCAQADRPVLFASFQRERFYSASERRWVELSRTARSAVVFADFTAPTPTTHGPLQVCVPFDAPINREWILVCDSADYPGCVVGWEPPGQARGRDDARRFETFWSLDPRVVRSAARICAHLSEQYSPVAPRLPELLLDQPPVASADLRRASGVLDRMLGYLSASGS